MFRLTIISGKKQCSPWPWRARTYRAELTMHLQEQKYEHDYKKISETAEAGDFFLAAFAPRIT